MPNFEGQAIGSRKDDFEKAEANLEEIKKTQAGELSLEELQALVAKRQELSGEKEKIVEADHEEALGMEESRNVAAAEAVQAEQARQEAVRQAEEKATSEAADVAKAEALLTQIKGGETPQVGVVEVVEKGVSPSDDSSVIETGQKKKEVSDDTCQFWGAEPGATHEDIRAIQQSLKEKRSSALERLRTNPLLKSESALGNIGELGREEISKSILRILNSDGGTTVSNELVRILADIGYDRKVLLGALGEATVLLGNKWMVSGKARKQESLQQSIDFARGISEQSSERIRRMVEVSKYI